MKRARVLVTSMLLAAAACASVPKPPVLAEVDGARRGPVATDARTYAPSAMRHADALARDANAAFDAGDVAGAQILGEHALAAIAHAHALARIARAEEASRAAQRELERATGELAALDAEQARVAAEADALELKLKVVRDAQPVVPSGPADPAREKARRAAARAMALEARLLCTAARLLAAGSPPPEAPAAPPPTAAGTRPTSDAAPGTAELASAQATVDELDADLAGPGVAPIDKATRARAGCLAALTAVRRAKTPVTRAPGLGDALLAELSAASLAPSRDDRGVVVTIRGAFAGDRLSAAAAKQLADLGRVAAAHPAFPVVVVVHDERDAPRGKDQRASRARADAVVEALQRASAPKVEAVLAGGAAPLVEGGPKARAQNARVEIVFVTPEAT